MAITTDLSTDIGKVRLHINDTNDGTGGQAKFTDAEITYAISEGGGTFQGGVIKCIQFLMAKVSDPNFKADWLEVNNEAAFKSLEKLLRLKRQELGIPQISASVTHVYRADSRATEEPDFSEIQAETDDDTVIIIVDG